MFSYLTAPNFASELLVSMTSSVSASVSRLREAKVKASSNTGSRVLEATRDWRTYMRNRAID